MTVKIEYIAIGRYEDMISEYAAFDPCAIGVAEHECKYLVLPIGNAQWDTEWFSTKKDAAEAAKYYVKLEDVKVCWI